MLFNSLHFLCFFVIVTTFYFVLPHRYRWFNLLIASCYFYMAFVPAYILILGGTILVDYVAGIYIEKSTGYRRKFLLMSSLVANIGVLAVFKYYNFLNQNLSLFLQSVGWTNSLPYLSMLLPIGLSFHTFQAMSYTIEVYRGNQRAERHLGIYALYILFYPQLVAGPIERPQNILHQFYEKHTFDYANVTNGLKRMAWGLFKKVVIADRLAMAVNAVYDNPTAFVGMPLIVATVCFAFQIYCDFSGYSDIAIGAAQVMGFRLMKNFDRPYFSTSISEFWRRWHISLSTWFRDYVYIPLGGNRAWVGRVYTNLLITFLLSGLWHGANWTFVVWGGLNGLFLILEQATGGGLWAWLQRTPLRSSPFLSNLLAGIITFMLVCFTWIFFRADSLNTAWYILTHLFVQLHESLPVAFSYRMGFARWDAVVAVFSVGLLLLVEWQQRGQSLLSQLSRQPVYVRWSGYVLLGLLIVFLGVFDRSQQFIYFQF